MSQHGGNDAGCVGLDGLGGCKYRPVYVVAGDIACAYHLQSLVKMRLAEVHGPVTVDTYPPADHPGRSAS